MITRIARMPGRGPAPRHPRTPFLPRILIPLLLTLLTVSVGTIGYRVIEGWPLLDALYMTIITLTTIGYGVPHTLTVPGEIFTIVLIVTTIGVAGYAVSTLVTILFEGELNRFLRGRRMDKRITHLLDHVIVCGYGRTGRYVAEELRKTERPYVVIESDEEGLEQAEANGDLYLQGDATDDDVLRAAGIDRARGLVATLGDDRINMFIVLSARALNPSLRIVARADDDENLVKMRRAGADEAISPSAIGGLRMASSMIRPHVVSFLDEMLRAPKSALRVEEIPAQAVRGLVGRTAMEEGLEERGNIILLAVRLQEGGYRFNPTREWRFREGDTLIVIGEAAACRNLLERRA